MNDPISVILVDDHALVRQGVRAFLQTQEDISVVGEAGSGEEGVALAATLVPDVALVDLLMPGMSGVETTRGIKAASPRTTVIVLTSFHDHSHVVPAIRAGALSYLLKDVSPADLADAIRKASRGEVSLSPQVATQVMQILHTEDLTRRDALADLTQREIEVLGLIAEGLSNASIGERLYISEKTVKSHVGNILAKLQLDDRTQAAVYAWRRGLAN